MTSTVTTVFKAPSSPPVHVVREGEIGFRAFLPDLSSPRFARAQNQPDASAYADHFNNNQDPPWLYNLTQAWEKLYSQPFKGVTSDGIVRKRLFEKQDEQVPIDHIVSVTQKLLRQLNKEQEEKLMYPVNAKEWRAWSNPEMLLRPFGLRLEEVAEEIAQSILAVVEASFSPAGFQKALAAMRINHFLGELCKIPQVMNQYSYNFLLFGTPSLTEAWGWSLYGHHLCLNTFFKGSQIVISPYFTGAEPNLIDQGPWVGTGILHNEGDIGLALMQSLEPHHKRTAQTYKLLRDPAMKQTGDLIVDRWNRDDQRHMCGAFRDNRVVPYEGVCVMNLDSRQRRLVLAIADEFLLYLPEQSRRMKLQQIQQHFEETFFSWIGGFGDDDAFYYRIQSPVIIFEFDHHSGVFLSNSKPAKFHTHTIVRTPNAGDYGNALRGPEECVK